MKSLLVILLLYVLCEFCSAIECDKVPKNDELRLKKDMMCNYDKSVRPMGGSKNATTVKVKMILKSYDYLDYANSITVSVWMVLSWTDEHFKWDSREYGGLKTFYEMSTEIWMPDFSLYNNAKESDSCETTNCIIHSNGLVICIPPCQFQGLCRGSFKHWPFDRQNCTFTFGTWVQSGEEVNFVATKSSVDHSESLLNHDWKLLSVAVKRNSGNYACCPNQTFPTLMYEFMLERHESVFAVFLLVPTIGKFIFSSPFINLDNISPPWQGLKFLCLMNIISLLISPYGNERWILISVSFLGHQLFIQQMHWTVPRNGATIPSVLVFYRDSTAILAVLLINTFLVRYLLSLQCDVPGWLSSPVDVVKESAAGKFIVHVNLGKMERIEEVADDDTTILVEPKAEDHKNKDKWQFIATLIDRLVLICVLVTYFFLIIILIPEGYESISDLPELNIVTKQ
ncbi:acetylcholine receptor subunit alpha-like 2 [Phlebotomus argentipes]|uniref:acetylcholine receptor subunit alpha-like 2 n=1 Tax=Phlebotomus argentipes TaxID=94469 RepID=UPI002892CDE3|nr:acetylcholine receptor subunit alpha-like 2 [Phlebotomus argentipes]